MEEYVIKAIKEIDKILFAEGNSAPFYLVCIGLDINDWEYYLEIDEWDGDVDLNDEFVRYLKILMLISKIDYLEISWDGIKFLEFFPIDIFAKIDELCDMFEICFSNENYEKMIELSAEITDLCIGLAEEYNDTNFLDLAIEYEEMLIEYALGKTILEVSESEMQEYFSEPYYDLDDTLSCYIDEDDFGDISSIDWEIVLNPEHKQFTTSYKTYIKQK